MQTLFCIALISLCSLSYSSVLSKQCSERQYAWPVLSPRHCCEKCPPGKYMLWRATGNCDRKCEPCPAGSYIDSDNVEMQCEFCVNCNKGNMDYDLKCTPVRNAVCKCKDGYKCKDRECTMCLSVPTAINSTLPPSSLTDPQPGTATTTSRATKPHIDMTGYLVIVALLCLGITLIVLTKKKPVACWIRSNQRYFVADKPAAVGACTESEGMSKPVQEMCGKCDQPIGV
ncbi:uncharacterized protein ACBR49_005443 [Aulostomus maculatus]